ncbi:hypothetical protein SISNIDRAFT_490024 [Sistotremastrum niveocremeum HHB9708]|uniref:Uncharacterized protein n=1 Tax=Sistotremastrum niveocremeum HHB9708 TaxID=1314777 RepID=A0A164PCT7_9AGAM|nr:hypothetical protein SISNIDRAFT_490024 [Sistotremastrum niveocremeum HHB9708]
MPIFEDFEIWVEIEDERLPEHVASFEDLRSSENKVKINCYIASEAGKEFEICVVDNRRGRNNLVFTDVFLDGALMTRRYIEGSGRIGTYIRDSQSQLPFLFQEFNQPISVKQQISTRRTGEIKACVGFLRNAQKTAPRKITPRPIPSHFASNERPEDVSIRHLATLGDPGIGRNYLFHRLAFEVSSLVPLSSDLERVSTVILTNLPTFEFIFLYAPEHLLRSMGIIEPLPPSDPPSPMTSISGDLPEVEEEQQQSMTDDDCTYLDAEESYLYRQLREKIATRRRTAAQRQHATAGSGLNSDGFTSLL